MQIEAILGIILAALLAAFFGSVIPRKLKDREKFNDAATTFRSKVLTELEGIYPIARTWWDERVYPQFIQSIPKIETASAEFRHFIKRKAEFDTAVKAYREYCEKRIYEKAMAWSCYPDMHTPDEIGPAEAFKNIIEHLFSFTVKK